jgi:hypothetical protein
LYRNKKKLQPEILELFKVCFGPFNVLDHNKPFIFPEQKRPLGGSYYPASMTKTTFFNWIKKHPKDKSAFESPYTVIRQMKSKLVAIPYSKEYAKLLKPIAKLLFESAKLADNKSLKMYLLTRAKSLLTNDYFHSDMAWMDLDDPFLEIVIGPYEVYADELLSYKAAFESFITIIDPEESKKLKLVEKHLQEMEDYLPIEDKFKNRNRGSSSPVKVVNLVYTAGDSKAGVQTMAFNLPNDERVREAKGSKKVMLKNIAEAKFNKIWMPIVKRVLKKEELRHCSFKSYFNHVVMHEVSHGLGPGNITINNRKTTVSKELKELYPTIEECKADTLGIYFLHYFVEKGYFDFGKSFFKKNVS